MLSSFFCSFSWVRAPPKEMKSDIKWAFFTYSNTLEIHVKLIGVQSNHGVEYFGGPALPTLRFLHNQNQQFLHNQWFPHNQHNILSKRSELVPSTLLQLGLLLRKFHTVLVGKDYLRNEHLVYTCTQCTDLSQNLPFTSPCQKKLMPKIW